MSIQSSGCLHCKIRRLSNFRVNAFTTADVCTRNADRFWIKLRKILIWGGANGEMANLTNEKGKFAIAIFRHFSPFFAIFRHW